MDPLCYLYVMFIFVMSSYLFLAASSSPFGKGLTSWLSLVCYIKSCTFVTLPYGVPGQV